MTQEISTRDSDFRSASVPLALLVDESITWSPPSLGSGETTLFVLVRQGNSQARVVRLSDGRAEEVSPKGVPFSSPLLQPQRTLPLLALSLKTVRFVGYFAVAVLLVFTLAINLNWLQARVVLTDSMSGTIERGDLVVTAPWLEPTVGSVAIFEARDLQGQARAEFVHRIIAGDPDAGFQFRGDNNDASDLGTVKVEDVKGVVWFFVPGVGNLLQPQVMIALFSAGLFLYLLGSWVRDEIIERAVFRNRRSR